MPAVTDLSEPVPVVAMAASNEKQTVSFEATDLPLAGVSSDGTSSEESPLPSAILGYPMSRHVTSLPNHQLSYEAREVACHSVENYRDRLKSVWYDM